MENITDVEKSIMDYEDDKDTDVKIKPNFYIHNAILKMQNVLMFGVGKTNIGEGIIAYTVLVEQIEVLCKSAGYINDEYDEKIKNYTSSEEYKAIKKDEVRMAKLANKKLGLLMRTVFSKAPVEMPINLDAKID